MDRYELEFDQDAAPIRAGYAERGVRSRRDPIKIVAPEEDFDHSVRSAFFTFERSKRPEWTNEAKSFTSPAVSPRRPSPRL